MTELANLCYVSVVIGRYQPGREGGDTKDKSGPFVSTDLSFAMSYILLFWP